MDKLPIKEMVLMTLSTNLPNRFVTYCVVMISLTNDQIWPFKIVANCDIHEVKKTSGTENQVFTLGRATTSLIEKGSVWLDVVWGLIARTPSDGISDHPLDCRGKRFFQEGIKENGAAKSHRRVKGEESTRHDLTIVRRNER